MSLTTSIAAQSRNLTLNIAINGVPILATNPTSPTGIPAIAEVHIRNLIGQLPTCQFLVSRMPTWVLPGQAVTVDVGYDGFTKRRFTGTVQNRGKGIGRGTIDCVGTTAPLYTTAIVPDQTFTGQTTAAALGTLLTYLGLVNRVISTTRTPDMVEFTMGSVVPAVLSNMSALQMVNTIMELQGCKVFETGAGVTQIAVLDQMPAITAFKTYTTNANATAKILTSDIREDASYVRTRVKVNGATPEGGVPVTQIALVGGVSPLVKPPLPAGSYIDAGIFNGLADTQTKVSAMALYWLTQWHRRPHYLDVDIPGDPEIECAATIGLVIPEQDINSLWFTDGWEDNIVIPQGDNTGEGDFGTGYRTTLRLRGGDDLGGTLTLAPFASFTMAVEREVFGTGATDFVTVNLVDTSFDPDGTIASRVWTSNKTTTLTMASSTNASRTVRIDSASLDGSGTDWTITLTVTDNSGATAAVTQIVPYPATGQTVIIPAIGVAYNSGAGFSPDGAQHWNTQAGATCVSVGLRPADGIHTGHACYGFSNGHIGRTTDGCQTALTTVYTFPSGSAVMDIQWDWRNSNIVWAISNNCELAISLNEGVTWALYGGAGLRTTLGLSGALGNLIGLPGNGGVYIFGGNGTGTPLIAFDATVGSNAWAIVTMLGDPVTDFPADATMRIVGYTAPGRGREWMILAWASGGGASIAAIYTTTSGVSTARTFTRATGLTVGLKNGRWIAANAPLAPSLAVAMFGDQDAWATTNGVAWAKTAGSPVLPAGVTPNHGIYGGGNLTGNPDIDDFFLVAAENAGGTLGVYKTADAFLTAATVLWPAGGSWPVWPSSGKAKKLSVGAPGSSVANANQLARVSQGNIIQAFDNSSHWSALGTGSGTQGQHLQNLGGGHWIYLNNPGTSGTVYHSGNSAATFSAVLSATADVGCYGLDVSADGTVWAVMGNQNVISTGAARSLLIYKSTDHGASFTLVYTDPLFTGGAITNGNTPPFSGVQMLCASKTNPNAVFVLCAGSVANMAKCIYTIDGGANWVYRTAETGLTRGTTNSLSQVQFVNNNRVLYMRSQSTVEIYYTDDYGATWTLSATSFSANIGRALGPYHPTWGNRCVIGVDPTGAELGRVWLSINNGLTWTDILGADVGYTIDAIEYDASTDTAYIAHSGTSEAVGKITGVTTGAALTDITFDSGNAVASVATNFLALPR